jgi:DNA helicase-2/ATP-dependent DNA helicase PcrA
MQHSKQQLYIFDRLENTNKHLCIASTAGSGKTTTILECLKRVPRFSRSIFLSFSNTIVQELKDRVPNGVQASTLHSLGCRMIMRAYVGVVVNENKYFEKALNLLYPLLKDRNTSVYRDCYRIQDICHYLRATLTEENIDEVRKMCIYYNLEFTDDLLVKVLQVMVPEKVLRHIDFTDMIYLPVKDSTLVTQKFDFVFLDEAQDLNNCQTKFIDLLLSTKGRLISAGDSSQSIYSFMGASIDSFEKLQQRENTEVCNLSVSYRCGKNIVRKAREIDEFIESYEANEEGVVRYGEIEEIREGDIVICRTTKPLVALYFYLLRDRKKATIIGKDIESGLVKLATRCKSSSLNGIQIKFKNEVDNLVEELKNIGVKRPTEHIRYGTLIERIEVLKILLEYCEPKNLILEVHELFKTSRKSIKLMTLHKSKGLENERVFILERYRNEKQLPSKYAQQDWEKKQEKNLEFVAYTRAKSELIFIDVD